MTDITVFTARKVRTMEPSMPTAEAVAVRGDRIVEVGSLASMQPWLDAYDHEIDDTFRDHVIMPGLIDPHLHPSMAAILLPMHFTTAVEWDLPWSDIGAVGGRVEFLDRLISMAMPRIRDFRGVSRKAFDGRGNYSLGLKEQIVFPEIEYDKVDRIHGMNITFVTTAKTDAEALSLLKHLGMPFRAK